jgi:hypothetical protein
MPTVSGADRFRLVSIADVNVDQDRPLEKLRPMALEIHGRELTNRVTTSVSPARREADPQAWQRARGVSRRTLVPHLRCHALPTPLFPDAGTASMHV